MAAKLFLVDQVQKYLVDGTIDLDTDTIKVALSTDVTPSYSARQNATIYSLGDIIVPDGRNGHRYKCTTAGSSHSSPPTFPTTDGATVTDGTVIWTEWGGDLDDLTTWGDLDANEVANGDGYTTGGVEIGSKTLTVAGKILSFSAGSASWTGLTKTFRYAWIYKSGTANAIVDPLVGYILMDTAMNDVVVSGLNYVINWNGALLTWTRQ